MCVWGRVVGGGQVATLLILFTLCAEHSGADDRRLVLVGIWSLPPVPEAVICSTAASQRI